MPYKITRDPADDVFSQYIRIRDKECVRCYSPVQFNNKGMPISHQASHFMGRRKEATRFEPDNVDTLCGGCHTYLTAHPAEHYLFQVKLKGQKRVDSLILQSNTYVKKDRKLQKLIWTEALKELTRS